MIILGHLLGRGLDIVSGQRVARFVVGVIGILVFWRGLAFVLASEPLALGPVLRYICYALTVLRAL